MTAPTPYDWVKQVSTSLLQLDEKPLFGASPSFPWEQFAKEWASIYELTDFLVTPTEMQWRGESELIKGLGSHVSPLTLTLSGVEGECSWIMSKGDISTLMQLLLTKKPEAFEILDPQFIQGFYHFLAAQTIHIISKLDFDKNFSATIQDKETVPSGDAFSIDIALTFASKKILGRLLLPSPFLRSWKERFADRKLGIDLTSPLAQKLQVIIHIEAGKTTLGKHEWSKVKPGDFILLDQCSLDLKSDKGRVLLTLNGLPMFRAKLKQGNLKILEYPLTLETEAPMNNENEGEDFEDVGEESDIEEFETDEIATDEKEEQFGEEEKESAPPKEALSLAEKTPAGKKTGFEASDIPLTITIEVGRLQMSIQKLMELQPGNMLELNIHPEDGVDLVVSGRRIAKGELLRIGEALGVRILDIG